MQTAAWMSSKGVGRGKGSAGLGVAGIQFPASCLIESFKTGAFLQETESSRAANLELYGDYFVRKKRKLKDHRGPPGPFARKGHAYSKRRNAFLRRCGSL